MQKQKLTPFQERAINDIITIVCNYFHQKNDVMFVKKRTKQLVNVRQFVFYFIRETLPDISLVALAELYNLNHATIIHSVSVVKNQAMVDSTYKNQLLDLNKLISEKHLGNLLESNGLDKEIILKADADKYIRKFQIIGEAMWYDLKLGGVVTKDDFISYFKFLVNRD